MKKKKRKLNKKRILIVLILFILCIYNCSKFIYGAVYKIVKSSLPTSSQSYDIIKQDINKNYPGIGQKQVKDKDGYFTTFTTINGKTYIEYKQNYPSTWSSKAYWDANMEKSGCGITAISIILSGYNKNYTPEDLRQKYYPVLNGDNISSELTNTFGIKNTDFYYDSTHISNSYILEHLSTNRPILVCVWTNPSQNRWTTSSHYMVLLACSNNNMVYVSNPNGLENTPKSSGWYDINEVVPYIAKALFICK